MRLWVCSSQRSQRQKGTGWHHCPPWLNTADNIKTWILVVASFFTKISTISRRLINKSQYQSQGAGVQRARQKPQLKTRRSTLHFWLFWSALAYRLCYIDCYQTLLSVGEEEKNPNKSLKVSTWRETFVSGVSELLRFMCHRVSLQLSLVLIYFHMGY